ncbi:hypothetical protein ACH4M4_32250 [Streptomyces sp. NPDC017254]|uniref:hypothetical protein n=1 Tax=unclassified Streptomyces TaxID=2593676 RepID=UPI00378D773C
MNEHERRHRRAGAEGESDDREARNGTHKPVPARAGDTDVEGADGHRAKRQRPGVGREEQTEER